MTSVALYNQDGSQNGTVELNDAIFAVEVNQNAVYEAILRQRASLRQGLTPLRTALPFAVVVRSHGGKRGLVGLGKVPFAPHNSVVVGSSLAQPLVPTTTGCHARFANWLSSLL